MQELLDEWDPADVGPTCALAPSVREHGGLGAAQLRTRSWCLGQTRRPSALLRNPRHCACCDPAYAQQDVGLQHNRGRSQHALVAWIKKYRIICCVPGAGVEH
jgi:hypothetical protein